MLIALDERGKAERARVGRASASARARGWAVLAPDLRGTGESAAGEFELATAAWMLDRDLLASRVDDALALVQWLSERYSTGQQIDARRIAMLGPGGIRAASRCSQPALDERVAGAAERALRREPRGTARREPGDDADGVSVRAPSRRSTWTTSRVSAGPASCTSSAGRATAPRVVGGLLDALEASA